MPVEGSISTVVAPEMFCAIRTGEMHSQNRGSAKPISLCGSFHCDRSDALVSRRPKIVQDLGVNPLECIRIQRLTQKVSIPSGNNISLQLETSEIRRRTNINSRHNTVPWKLTVEMPHHIRNISINWIYFRCVIRRQRVQDVSIVPNEAQANCDNTPQVRFWAICCIGVVSEFVVDCNPSKEDSVGCCVDVTRSTSRRVRCLPVAFGKSRDE